MALQETAQCPQTSPIVNSAFKIFEDVHVFNLLLYC